jgi:hypothetical protein
VPDYSGLVAFETFYGVWPTGDIPAEAVAAILNGHVANAYASPLNKQGARGRRALDDVPIPELSKDTIGRLTDLASIYRTERAQLRSDPTRQRAARCLELLESIDAIVLKAYGLPLALEAELLEYVALEPRPALKFLTRVARHDDAPMLSLFPDDTDLDVTSTSLGSVDEADAALEADLQRLEERLRSERPELFDESGAFREEEAQRLLEQHAAHQKAVADEALAALTRGIGRRSADAT